MDVRYYDLKQQTLPAQKLNHDFPLFQAIFLNIKKKFLLINFR